MVFLFRVTPFSAINMFLLRHGYLWAWERFEYCTKFALLPKGYFYVPGGEGGGQSRLIFMLNGCIIGAEKRPLTGGLISGRSRTSDGGITGITTVTMTCFANVAQRNIP